jgi:hypothetical protein
LTKAVHRVVNGLAPKIMKSTMKASGRSKVLEVYIITHTVPYPSTAFPILHGHGHHWTFLLTDVRDGKKGTVYDVVYSEDDGAWERRRRENYDITASGTYENSVIMGRIDSSKIPQLEKFWRRRTCPRETRLVRSGLKEGWNL